MILTYSVSGLARSGATRSGYPVLKGVKVPLYALSNVGRSGATRSNYVGSRTFISVGGIQRGWGHRAGEGILAESLNLSDTMNATPTTLNFTARGWVPVEGQDIVITLGSINNPKRVFGGTVLSTRHRYVGDKPVLANMLYDVNGIDYTWGLDRRKVSGDYKQASIAAIAASLLTFAPGYTLWVDPDIGAAILDEITFTEQALSSALSQLVKRVGGDYVCGYDKVVQLFYVNSQLTPPANVNAVHDSLADLAFTRDLSQVITRCLGNFGGSTALEQIAPGSTLLPVDTAAWYLPQGGTVLSGQQRVNYSGLVVGGGGSLVGPGAAPTGAPNASLLPGAGVDVGTHDYAVTFKTASGESIAGPRLTVPVGVFLAPPTAPTPGTPGPGATGPDPGVHDYAVSFVISSGETVPGPRVSVSTALTPPPDTGPTPDTVSLGPGPDPGVHDYAVTFVTATGETPPSPIGGQVTTPSNMSPPASGPTGSAAAGTGLTLGTRQYAVTWVTARGETTPGPTAALTTPPAPGPSSGPKWNGTTYTGGQLPAGIFPANQWAWDVAFVLGAQGETVLSGSRATFGNSGSTAPNPYLAALLENIPIGPAGTTARRIYRTWAQANQAAALTAGVFLELTINNNTATTQRVGDIPDGSIGQSPSSWAALGVMNLTGIAVGPAGTTARKLYRSVAGGTQLQLVATIPDNTTTTYSDSTPDGSLGAAPPATNTAGGGQTVHVSGLQRGTGASSGAVTGRKLYRRSGGAGLRLVATIADNTSATYTDTTPNASLGAAPPAVNTATLRVIPLTAIPLGNSLVTARKIYRTPANTGGGTLKLVTTIADNTTTTFTDTVSDAALGAAALTVSTAQAAQVQLTSVPLGAPSVTARVIYRTKAGVSQLQLLVTLADNTTATYLDTKLDSTLGANVPISDTSLLQQPAGNVFAGSPSLPCASVAAFLPSGGWAIAGAQNIRYTGISGTNLVGIPATGVGAITATLSYNTTIVAAAMLTGVPASGLGTIKYTILRGDPVNVFVQVDDLAAQAAVRAQLPGSDGIIEDELQDGRLSYTEGRARCQARLDLLGARDVDGLVGAISVTYRCRDTNTIAGATVAINVGPPINLRGDYLIQRVSVAQFHVPNLNPIYTVEASSLRFSAEEMLRLLRQGAL
jgi:hypothetical protein